MSSERSLGSLLHEADQAASVLFFVRNTAAVTNGTLLHHKQPGVDKWRSTITDPEVAHQVIQELYRHLEYANTQPQPEQYDMQLRLAFDLYLRKRANYERWHPERVDRLYSQPLGDRVDPPTFPSREDYRDPELFYPTAFAETVCQVDAYRWMCDVESCLTKYPACDLMVPFENSNLSIDAGWQSVETLGHALMQALIVGKTRRSPISIATSEYGTDTVLPGIAAASDLVEQYIFHKQAKGRAEREQQK